MATIFKKAIKTLIIDKCIDVFFNGIFKNLGVIVLNEEALANELMKTINKYISVGLLSSNSYEIDEIDYNISILMEEFKEKCPNYLLLTDPTDPDFYYGCMKKSDAYTKYKDEVTVINSYEAVL